MTSNQTKKVIYGLDVSPGTFFAGTAFEETSITLKACGGGGVAVVSYQEVTGCLSQGAHPGSYNGQDAYNNMLVTEDGTDYGDRTSKRRNHEGGVPYADK